MTKLGTDTVSGVYGFGKSQVVKVVGKGQEVVTYGLKTPYGSFLADQFDATLDLSEKMLDKYLPEVKTEGSSFYDLYFHLQSSFS